MKRKVILFISLGLTLVYGIVIFILPIFESKTTLEFKKYAEYYNMDETGTITRRYVYTVNDTIWSDMVIHGKEQIFSSFGSTYTYYFLEDSEVPTEVFPVAPYFSNKSHKQCIAVYRRDPGNRESFEKYPFNK